MSLEIAIAVNKILGGRVNYEPHNITDTKVYYGVPPVRIQALEYVAAIHENQQSKYFKSLGRSGSWVSNKNQEGLITIAIMASTASCAAIELMALTGIPFPIVCLDTSTVAGGFFGGACRPMQAPEFRRELVSGVSIYQFETDRLIISSGVRITE